VARESTRLKFAGYVAVGFVCESVELLACKLVFSFVDVTVDIDSGLRVVVLIAPILKLLGFRFIKFHFLLNLIQLPFFLLNFVRQRNVLTELHIDLAYFIYR
jgi:hypothetical protein